MKIYYAHHIWKYNTPIEEYEIGVIKKTFPNAKIINPNGDVQQPGIYSNSEEGTYMVYERDTMSACFERVSKSDAIVFSAVSGVVGKGVYLEVEEARKNNKPVYYIYGNILIPFDGEMQIIPNGTSDRVYAVVRLL